MSCLSARGPTDYATCWQCECQCLNGPVSGDLIPRGLSPPRCLSQYRHLVRKERHYLITASPIPGRSASARAKQCARLQRLPLPERRMDQSPTHKMLPAMENLRFALRRQAGGVDPLPIGLGE